MDPYHRFGCSCHPFPALLFPIGSLIWLLWRPQAVPAFPLALQQHNNLHSTGQLFMIGNDYFMTVESYEHDLPTPGPMRIGLQRHTMNGNIKRNQKLGFVCYSHLSTTLYQSWLKRYHLSHSTVPNLALHICTQL